LFISEENSRMTDLAKLLNSAVTVVDLACHLDTTIHISQQCPNYIFEAVILAAAVLLKLVKGIPTDALDHSGGRIALFAAINLFKTISVVNNDIPAQVSTIFTGLWSSATVYKDSRGNYVRPLRVRNRLIASVAFDCFWWHREAVAGWPSQPAGQGEWSLYLARSCRMDAWSCHAK
jgi:hypothetical protein